MAGERRDYLSWDQYFMSIVTLSSMYSYGSGSCLVDSDNHLLSIGGKDIPYTIKEEIPFDKRLDYLVSPISNSLFTFKGNRSEFTKGTIYVSDFPTPEDAKNLAQARLSRMVYLTNSLSQVDEKISKKILNQANIATLPYFDESYSRENYEEFLLQFKEVINKYLRRDITSCNPKDEYFMAIATLSALRSKDPSTQVGACLVDGDNRVISVGYNGTPYGMSDKNMPWSSLGEQTGDKLNIKDSYVVHAEVNTLDNYRGQQDDLEQMKLYVTFSPCINCIKRLSMQRLEKIIWLRNYSNSDTLMNYNNWFGKSNINFSKYDDRDWTKPYYKEFFHETTKVIKRNLSKEKKIIY